MIKPISPKDVAPTKTALFPEGVITCWNDTIAKNYVNGRSHFKQNEIVELLRTRMNVDRGTVFANGWLDVEPIYEARGWRIKYDKPGFNESYEANFTFSDNPSSGKE